MAISRFDYVPQLEVMNTYDKIPFQELYLAGADKRKRKDDMYAALSDLEATPIQGGYRTQERAERFKNEVFNKAVEDLYKELEQNKDIKGGVAKIKQKANAILNNPEYQALKSDYEYKKKVDEWMQTPGHDKDVQSFFQDGKFAQTQPGEAFGPQWYDKVGYVDFFSDHKDVYAAVKPEIDQSVSDLTQSAAWTQADTTKRSKMLREHVGEMLAPYAADKTNLDTRGSARYRSALANQQGGEYDSQQYLNDLVDNYIGYYDHTLETKAFKGASGLGGFGGGAGDIPADPRNLPTHQNLRLVTLDHKGAEAKDAREFKNIVQAVEKDLSNPKNIVPTIKGESVYDLNSFSIDYKPGQVPKIKGTPLKNDGTPASNDDIKIMNARLQAQYTQYQKLKKDQDEINNTVDKQLTNLDPNTKKFLMFMDQEGNPVNNLWSAEVFKAKKEAYDELRGTGYRKDGTVYEPSEKEVNDLAKEKAAEVLGISSHLKLKEKLENEAYTKQIAKYVQNVKPLTYIAKGVTGEHRSDLQVYEESVADKLANDPEFLQTLEAYSADSGVPVDTGKYFGTNEKGDIKQGSMTGIEHSGFFKTLSGEWLGIGKVVKKGTDNKNEEIGETVFYRLPDNEIGNKINIHTGHGSIKETVNFLKPYMEEEGVHPLNPNLLPGTKNPMMTVVVNDNVPTYELSYDGLNQPLKFTSPEEVARHINAFNRGISPRQNTNSNTSSSGGADPL